MKKLLLVALFSLTLAACSSTPEVDEDYRAPESAENLYMGGLTLFSRNDWAAATKEFEEVERQHPYSPWATKAQLNIIYAHFKKEEYEEAISAAERFIRLHPRHKNVAYAYFMRGLAKYKQIGSAYHSQETTREAKAAFQEVISRFAGSDYAWESKTMLNLIIDRLAEQEMVVGRYYLDREKYVAAGSRFKGVVENGDFNRTIFAEEALFSLVLTSVKLGMVEEARDYAAILGHNFPESAFYERAFDLMTGRTTISKSELRRLRRGVEEGSILERLIKGLRPGMDASTLGQ